MNGIQETITYLNSKAEGVLDASRPFTFEFRTTLDPRYVDKNAIKAISCLISPNAVWYLQQFRARKGLLGGDYMADVKPYDEETLNEFVRIAKENVENVRLRWP